MSVTKGLEARKEAAKSRVGVTAAIAGREACPKCEGVGTLNIRRDDKGGRCGACQWSFDAIQYLMIADGLHFIAALARLESLDPFKPPDGRTGDLFSGGLKQEAENEE